MQVKKSTVICNFVYVQADDVENENVKSGKLQHLHNNIYLSYKYEWLYMYIYMNTYINYVHTQGKKSVNAHALQL